MKQENAKKVLESHKLKYNIQTSEDKTKEDGVVIKQNRKSGEVVPKNTVVTLTINKKATEADDKTNNNSTDNNKTTNNKNNVNEGR